MQWVTFTMALIAFALWVAAAVVGAGIYRANRASIQAMRAMNDAMTAATRAAVADMHRPPSDPSLTPAD